jgi:hypothetical protein
MPSAAPQSRVGFSWGCEYPITGAIHAETGESGTQEVFPGSDFSFIQIIIITPVRTSCFEPEETE